METQDERAAAVSRRSLLQRAAISLGLLLTAACSANNEETGPPTVVRVPTPVPTPSPHTPLPSPTSTPALNPSERILYVDIGSTSANDTNPGTSDHPLRTIGKAAALAIDNNARHIGTRIVIAPGTYREAVSVHIGAGGSDAPIHLEAMQDGTAIIAGSDVWTGWRRQGTTNIYTHSWPYKWGPAPFPPGWQGNVDLQPIVRRREMIFVNGNALTQVMSGGELQEGTFFVAEPSATVSLIPPHGVQMESATVEVAVRSGIFAVENARNLTVSGLVFMHDSTPVGGAAVTFLNSTSVIVEDCQFFWNNWAGLSFDSASPHVAQFMTARRNIANYNGGIGLVASRIREMLCEDNETSYNNWRGALGQMNEWANAGMKHLLIHGGTYRRNRAVENQAPGLWFDTDCTNIAIEDAFSCHNNGPGLFIEASQGPVKATNCTICGNTSDGGIFSNGGANVTLEGNTIYGNAEGQVRVVKSMRPIRDWETNQSLSITPEHWTLRNNIIAGSDDAPRLANIADSARFFQTFVSDDNAWFSPMKGSAFVLDGKRVDFSTWQSRSGQDAGSTNVDPRFVDPAKDDFHLRDDSPVKNR